MDLSSEDMLRLQVLLANARAIRIDEHKLMVVGLGPEREMEVRLNAVGNVDKYLKSVREYLSTAAFGSPRRYPKYIHRWADMGQINNVPVDKLLMLGEPEAMLAIAFAQRLDPDQAQRAWWAYPSPQLARGLLAQPEIMGGDLGRQLSHYLFEYLPFETESRDILGTVRLLLQAGHLSAEMRQSMWNKGQRKKVFRIGFLVSSADALPEQKSARADLAACQAQLSALQQNQDGFGPLLEKLLSEAGQSFLHAAMECLGKCGDHEEVNQLLDAIGVYCSRRQHQQAGLQTAEAIVEHMEAEMRVDSHVAQLLTQLPQMQQEVQAMLVLEQVSNRLMNPIFSRSDATGSVMRRQISPVTDFLLSHCRALVTSR